MYSKLIPKQSNMFLETDNIFKCVYIYNWMNNRPIENLLKLDDIRVFKLLEIIYYTIIAFTITLIIGNLLEDDNIMPYIFKTYDYENEQVGMLFLDIVMDLSIFAVILYYLIKLMKCIPFIFAPLNKRYTPSLKGEVITGINLGSGIVIYTSIKTIKDKISNFNSRIKSEIDENIYRM